MDETTTDPAPKVKTAGDGTTAGAVGGDSPPSPAPSGPARSARRAFMLLAGAAAVGGAATVVGAGPAEASVTIDGGTIASPNDVIQVRRGTAANWTWANPAVELQPGEIGVETDTGRVKLGSAAATPWGDLPYADGLATDAISAHLNEAVTLDGLATASALRGSETVLGLQTQSSGSASDVMLSISDLSRFGQVETVQLMASGADLDDEVSMVIAYPASDCQLGLTPYVTATYADLPNSWTTRRVRIIQTGLYGKVEICPRQISGQPDPHVSLLSQALTAAAEEAAAATPPTTPATRLRTKGQGSVVVAEAILVLNGVTAWVITGDVEAF